MSKQGHFEEHWLDENGNPAGGVSTTRGTTISWQNGPLGRIGTDERKEPNGAFVEDVIQMVIGRLRFYQLASNRKFNCIENAEAITALEKAAKVLDERTKRRESAKTEGTHEGN